MVSSVLFHEGEPTETFNAQLVFGRNANCPVRRLTLKLLSEVASLECALVFQMPSHVVDFVESLRGRYDVDAPSADQLTPHVTLLHLGVQQTYQLRQVFEALEASFDLTVRLGTFGTFVLSGGLVNYHLSIEPRGSLVTAQEKVMEWCGALSRSCFSSYVGNRFSPHVTVWDRAHPAPSIVAELESLAYPAEPFRLADLVSIGRIEAA